jgi:hypothetical protein
MTSIRVIDDAGDTHILDLYEDIVPKASYQFKDIRQPSRLLRLKPSLSLVAS